MSDEKNGSKPGLNTEHDTLARVHSCPNTEFTIPPSDNLARCKSVQSHTCDGPVSSVPGEHCTVTADEETQSISSQDGETCYPEGGLEAWLVILGSFCGLIGAFGMMNSIGVYQSYIKQHQLKDYSESTIGWIFSMYVFLAFFCGLQIGPVFDAHGPKWLVVAGSCLLCLSLFLLAECTKYWHFFLVFGVLGGFASSLIFVPCFSVPSHYFLKKRANATGIAACGGSIGGVIFPLTLQGLLPSMGFAWATRIVGFITLACCIVCCLLVKSRLPPKPGQSVLPDFKIFREPSYLLFTVAIFLMELALFIPIGYLASWAMEYGLTPEFSWQLLAIFNAGSCMGRWVPGLLADRLGRFNTMIAALAVCGAATLTLWLPASLLTSSNAIGKVTIKGLGITYAVVFGFCSGSNISLTPVCIGQLCHISQYGRWYATCYTVVSFGTLTGIPIAGSLIQAAGGRYWAAVTFTASCYVLASACCVWSRSIKVGWRMVKF